MKTSPVNAAPGVLKGDVKIVMEWVMNQFDKTVASLVAAQCWGYAPREIRGGYGYSNHASGTAIDLNSAQFPQGRYNMSKTQIGACRQIVKQSGSVIRWGGDFTGVAVDQMHFEIAPGKAGKPVAALAKKLSTPKETPLMVTAADEIKIRTIVRDEIRQATKALLTTGRAVASQRVGWLLRGDGDERIGNADILKAVEAKQ